MKIKIDNKEIELKYSFRALMFYEKICGEVFAPKGLNEMIYFFYAVVVSSDYNLNLDFENFMDWLDEKPNELNEFSNWLLTIITRNDKFKEEDIKEEKIEQLEDNTKKKE